MYTDNHLRYVAAAIIKLYKNREGISGLNRVYATKLLSHFTARFEPMSSSSAATLNGTSSSNGIGAVDAVNGAVDAASKAAAAAAGVVSNGLQKMGLSVSANGPAAAAAPAGGAEEASDQTDVAAGGVQDSFDQEAQQPMKQQQAW